MYKHKKDIIFVTASGTQVILAQNVYVHEVYCNNILRRYYISVTTYERLKNQCKITKNTDVSKIPGYTELVVPCLIVNK